MVRMFWKKAKYPAPPVELTTVLWLPDQNLVTPQITELFYLHATLHLPKRTIFTQMQDEVFFPLNLVLIYVVSS